MNKPQGRVFTPDDILERARAGEPTTGLAEGRVAVETWATEDVEIRTEGDGMTFSGYAAVFDSPSEPMPFIERIRHGAFKKSLAGAKRSAIKMFWNHNSDLPLGSTRANLTLIEDDKGLLSENRFPDTTQGRDMATLVRDKIVDSMSFGFQTVRDVWNADFSERELVEIRLFEVSPVTGWPAYQATSASVRELAGVIDVEPDDLAEALRVLRATGESLTPAQHDLIVRLANERRGDSPLIAPRLAGARALWAGLSSY